MFYSNESGFTIQQVHEDQKELPDSYWEEMVIGQAQGKVISTDQQGLPYLADPPPLTNEQLALIAEATKANLMAEATRVIAPLEDAQKYAMATAEELSSLEAWQKYRVMLFRVNTSLAPDIEWPITPKT
jgi:hypothetical protein